MKLFGRLLLILWTPFVGAKATFFDSCQSLPVQEETFMVLTQKPVLLFIHNESKTDLWLTHPVSEPNASAGWSSRLQVGNWSALAVDKNDFELSCIESKPGHEQQVPCKGLISVCRIHIAIMPKGTQGTFWAGEDMSLTNLLPYLANRGFALSIPQ